MAQYVTLDQLLEFARRHATRPGSPLHGVDHWRQVGRNGEQLAADTQGADLQIVRVFAAFHDSQRRNEGPDLEHGTRAAEVVRSLGLDLSPERMETLCAALVDHDRGRVSDDPTIGVCWDADRLELARVGFRVRLDLLSTEAGRGLARSRGITFNAA